MFESYVNNNYILAPTDAENSWLELGLYKNRINKLIHSSKILNYSLKQRTAPCFLTPRRIMIPALFRNVVLLSDDRRIQMLPYLNYKGKKLKTTAKINIYNISFFCELFGEKNNKNT